jgi:hypothetical protein
LSVSRSFCDICSAFVASSSVFTSRSCICGPVSVCALIEHAVGAIGKAAGNFHEPGRGEAHDDLALGQHRRRLAGKEHQHRRRQRARPDMIAALASIFGTTALLVSVMVTWTLPGSMRVISSTLPAGTPGHPHLRGGLELPGIGKLHDDLVITRVDRLAVEPQDPGPEYQCGGEHDAADHDFPAES